MMTRIYGYKTLTKSWKNGSTLWVITGPEGIQLIFREDVHDLEELYKSIESYLTHDNLKKYDVSAN
jgi:hypothetical protein